MNIQVQTAVKSGDMKALKACIFMAKSVPHFDLNGEDEDGVTGLIEACIAGNEEMVTLLLEAGADPNALSDGNRTPLMGACFLRKGVDESKSALCVKALLSDERTDPTIRNSFGESALDLAKIRGYNESIALVEKALEAWEKKAGLG